MGGGWQPEAFAIVWVTLPIVCQWVNRTADSEAPIVRVKNHPYYRKGSQSIGQKSHSMAHFIHSRGAFTPSTMVVFRRFLPILGVKRAILLVWVKRPILCLYFYPYYGSISTPTIGHRPHFHPASTNHPSPEPKAGTKGGGKKQDGKRRGDGTHSCLACNPNPADHTSFKAHCRYSESVTSAPPPDKTANTQLPTRLCTARTTKTYLLLGRAMYPRAPRSRQMEMLALKGG